MRNLIEPDGEGLLVMIGRRLKDSKEVNECVHGKSDGEAGEKEYGAGNDEILKRA